MIIGIAGIKRSFSTGQYNLVRIAMGMAGYQVEVFGHNYSPQQTGTVQIFKRHPFKKELAEAADHIFLTDRSDKGIKGSLTRLNGKPPYEGRLENMRKHLKKWKAYSDQDHYFRYSLWMNEPKTYTAKIIKVLGVNVDYRKVLEAFNSISLPEDEIDPVTRFLPNHITSE